MEKRNTQTRKQRPAKYQSHTRPKTPKPEATLQNIEDIETAGHHRNFMHFDKGKHTAVTKICHHHCTQEKVHEKESLTPKSESGEPCATPGRRKCFKSRVRHSLLQPCIHTIHTQLTSDRNSFLSLTISIHRNIPSVHINRIHKISLTPKSE